MSSSSSLSPLVVFLGLLALSEVGLVVSGAAVPVLSSDLQESDVVSDPGAEVGVWRRRPSQSEIREELQRQLFMLQAAQESIVSKINEMASQQRPSSSSNPKRSHYANMCMFNVVACYRKRK